jgi:hypothetical protein
MGEEDIDHRVWARSWLSGLLARELPPDSLYPLWDHYFALLPADYSLHLYVCLGTRMLHQKSPGQAGVFRIWRANPPPFFFSIAA